MFKAVIFISTSLLAWVPLLVYAIPMKDIDSNKVKSSLFTNFDRQRTTPAYGKSFLTPSQTDKMIKEAREKNHLFDLRERDRQKAKDQGGLTEAQQKRADQNHAKLQQRIRWEIGY